MENVRIRYSYTVDAAKILEVVSLRLATVSEEPNLADLIGEICGDVHNCRTLDDIDAAMKNMSIAQLAIEEAHTALEESKAIMQAYRQALSGEYESAGIPEEQPPPKPNAMQAIEQLKDLASSIRQSNDDS